MPQAGISRGLYGYRFDVKLYECIRQYLSYMACYIIHNIRRIS